MKEIRSGAFVGCTSLEEIEIPSTVKKTGNWLFQNCFNLKKAKISCPTISMGTFSNCKSLTDILLSRFVNTIESFAFENCDALKTMIIPETVKNIEKQAVRIVLIYKM